MMNKINRENIRSEYLAIIVDYFNGTLTEEVLRTKTNEIAIPVVDQTGEEGYVVITVRVPTGSRDGEAYDGYSMAQEYEINQKLKKEKAEEVAKKKARKIKADTERRAAAKLNKN